MWKWITADGGWLSDGWWCECDAWGCLSVDACRDAILVLVGHCADQERERWSGSVSGVTQGHLEAARSTITSQRQPQSV